MTELPSEWADIYTWDRLTPEELQALKTGTLQLPRPQPEMETDGMGFRFSRRERLRRRKWGEILERFWRKKLGDDYDEANASIIKKTGKTIPQAWGWPFTHIFNNAASRNGGGDE